MSDKSILPSSVRPLSGGPMQRRLRDVVLGAMAAMTVPPSGPAEAPELQRLLAEAGSLQKGMSIDAAVRTWMENPPESDRVLGDVARRRHLTPVELVAVALGILVERELWLGRLLATLQSPIGGARPTVGFLQSLFERDKGMANSEAVLADLLEGDALNIGLLTWVDDAAPLPERGLMVPVPLMLALAGQCSHWPGVRLGREVSDPKPRLPKSMMEEARVHARSLQGARGGVLLIRSGNDFEKRVVVCELAEVLGKGVAFIETDRLAGLGIWLELRGLLPVFPCDLGPGERRRLQSLPGYSGPFVATAGFDGSIESPSGPTSVWSLTIPNGAERSELWRGVFGEAPSSDVPEDGATLPPSIAERLGRHHRHGAGRIVQLGAMARRRAAMRGEEMPNVSDVVEAAWSSDVLDGLAEPIRTQVPEGALVVSALLRQELHLLVERCRARDGLADPLGASAQVRYRPGVRALFVGPSGCGKSLAAGWLATQLQLPMYRVDLASTTSKYIGETEKNLARLLSRAEQSEVILLFDEADSMFGKRTEVRDSNDRFANAQTNYLLQRLETYEGLVVLTSNSKTRFDGAFARRLDVVLEFQLPTPEERRALWMSHLGGAAAELTPAELNQLAALADLPGGHIRNAVLTAALHAGRSRKIRLRDCLIGLTGEYRKLGRQLPGELARYLEL